MTSPIDDRETSAKSGARMAKWVPLCKSECSSGAKSRGSRRRETARSDQATLAGRHGLLPTRGSPPPPTRVRMPSLLVVLAPTFRLPSLGLGL